MRREGPVSTVCACARFSVYFAVKLSVNVQAHTIHTYLDSADFACACSRYQAFPPHNRRPGDEVKRHIASSDAMTQFIIQYSCNMFTYVHIYIQMFQMSYCDLRRNIMIVLGQPSALIAINFVYVILPERCYYI